MIKKRYALHILRIGLAVTFVWIGVLIFRDPVSWGGYLLPWAVQAIPIPIDQFMVGVAVFDMLAGLFLLFNLFTPYVAFLATLHLIGVLVGSGINAVTVRDIGLLFAAFSLFVYTSKN